MTAPTTTAPTLDALARHLPDILIATDRDWRITYANPPAESLFDRPASEMLGKELWEEASELASFFHRPLTRVLRTGTAESFIGFYSTQARWFRTCAFPMDGGVAVHMTDISDQRREVEQLRESEERFHAMLEAAVDAIITITDRGIIQSVNPSARLMFGYTAEEMVGQNVHMLMPSHYVDHHDELMKANLRSGRFTVVGRGRELVARHKDGSEVLIEMAVSEVRVNNRCFYTGVIRDITERKRAQQALVDANLYLETRVEERTAELTTARQRAEEAARAKADFLAMMSHEIRTPMNGILGMVRLLLDTSLDAEQRDYAQTVRYSGEALLTILNDILDMSKLDAGRMTLESVDFDLPRLVDSVVTLMSSRATEHGLSLTATIAPDVPRVVSGDPTRLRQVLLNLVSNAIKFTETGGIAIAVDRADSPAIRFTVTDTGIGMAPDVIPQLFSEFVQADSSISRRFGGTGLGLAICKRIVDLMGGAIEVDSAPGVGSTFRVTAPFPAALETAAYADAPKPTAPQVQIRPLRVLLAEDNPVNQKVAVALLSRQGHAVTVANDGLQALDRLSRDRFDVILMDMQMPNLDGLAATRRIRALPADQGGAVPIIALTANALAGDAERCLAAGMNDYVPKPIVPEALAAALARQCGLPPVEGADGTTEENADGEPLLDPLPLEALAGVLGEEDMRALVLDFVQDARAKATTLMAGEDLHTMRFAVHDLKSTSSTLGLLSLRQLAEAIEHACIDNHPAEAHALCATLPDRLDRSIAALTRRFPVMKEVA